jgi:hypothetical protein
MRFDLLRIVKIGKLIKFEGVVILNKEFFHLFSLFDYPN